MPGRLALAHALKATGLPVEVASGGHTKYNRSRQGVPKIQALAHTLDAACVSSMGVLKRSRRLTLEVKCSRRGSDQRTRLGKYGFARGYLMRSKDVRGLQTGDLVQANMPASSKKAGSYENYVARVAARASGNFNIQIGSDVVQGISHALTDHSA